MAFSATWRLHFTVFARLFNRSLAWVDYAKLQNFHPFASTRTNRRWSLNFKIAVGSGSRVEVRCLYRFVYFRLWFPTRFSDRFSEQFSDWFSERNRRYESKVQRLPTSQGIQIIEHSKFVQTYRKNFQQYKKYLILSLCLRANNWEIFAGSSCTSSYVLVGGFHQVVKRWWI